MVTERTKEKISELESFVASGKIYHGEFKALSSSLSFGLEKDTDLRDACLANRTEETNELYYAIPYYVSRVPGFAKKAKKLRGSLPLEVAGKLDEYLAFWLPVAELLKTAKEMVAPGRRPSEEPSKLRTLENTGSCPVCGGNFKLDEAGRIVNHGYTVEYHSFTGGCFGVGHQPFELSSKGASAYADALEVHVESLKDEVKSFRVSKPEKFFSTWLGHFVTKGYEKYDEAHAKEIRVKTHTVERLEKLVTYFRERVKNWKPETLPGIKAGFSK